MRRHARDRPRRARRVKLHGMNCSCAWAPVSCDKGLACSVVGAALGIVASAPSCMRLPRRATEVCPQRVHGHAWRAPRVARANPAFPAVDCSPALEAHLACFAAASRPPVSPSTLWLLHAACPAAGVRGPGWCLYLWCHSIDATRFKQPQVSHAKLRTVRRRVLCCRPAIQMMHAHAA